MARYKISVSLSIGFESFGHDYKLSGLHEFYAMSKCLFKFGGLSIRLVK